MNKKVLFVINTMGRGGAEVSLVETVRRFAEREDTKVDLLILTDMGELAGRLPHNVRILNKKLCESSVLSEDGRKALTKKVLKAAAFHGSGFRNFPYVVKNLAAMVKKKRILPDKLTWRILSDGAPVFDTEYDLAVAYIEGGSTYYVADHVKAKKKVGFIHIAYNEAGYTRELDRGCYEKLDRVLTVSDESRVHFLEVYPEYEDKTFVFHNIINKSLIEQRAAEEGGFTDGYDGYRILTVGRLVYQKAYDITIEAMRQIKEAGKKARWYVLGEGDLRSDLERQIERAGLKEDFILLGVKDNPYPYYKEADLYAHLTRFEGRSIAIQEAQALGKPIVASDCSGNREQLVSGEDGLLIDLSAPVIKDTLCRLMEHPEETEKYAKAAESKQLTFEKDMDFLFEYIDN